MAQPKEETSEQKSNDISIDALFKKYEERIHAFEANIDDFPTDGNRITSDRWKGAREQIKFHMEQTYPLVHGGVIALAYNFLTIKRKYGSSVEKKLYQNMTMVQFFDRLATKRAVVFFKASDSYTLRDGKGGYANWESVGTKQESNPKLEHYLSYDELIISAMCGISSPTHFVNNGDRRNCGRINENTWDLNERKGIYPIQGIYMGLVGARFERSNVMENALMAIDSRQNKQENGYGSYNAKNSDDKKQNDDEKNNSGLLSIDQELSEEVLLQRAKLSEDNLKKNNKVIMRAFEQFYDMKYLPTFEEIKAGFASNDAKIKSRYLEREGWNSSDYFDKEIFRQRIKVSLEVFLFDADRRASKYKEMYGDQLDKSKPMGAFCHIVGLGTGVWAFEKEEQNRQIVKVTKEIIESAHLKNIDCVYFSWLTNKCMYTDDTGKEAIYEKFGEDYLVKDKTKHGITIQFGRRAPADELQDPYRQCLITAMYAWDSNAFPGNEYYKGMLSASGDPAAASCSTIPFVQNSEINKEYINGKNTGIYFFDPKENKYQFKKLGDIQFEKNKEEVLKQSVMSIPYKRERLMKK